MSGHAGLPDRLMLWVDSVGGYLVCLRDEVTLGQPAGGTSPDVPIMGDLSRRQAIIRRQGESYSIEAVREVRLDGKPIKGTAPLWDGSLIELGQAVRLRFRRPHPLSATARLEFVSRHRTQPSTDAVLLMAESCILGRSSSSHVVAPGWQDEVVLFRQGSELAWRSCGQVVGRWQIVAGTRNAEALAAVWKEKSLRFPWSRWAISPPPSNRLRLESRQIP